MTSPVLKHAVDRGSPATEASDLVFNGSQLKAEIYRTVHGAEKSVEQLAWECRVSPSYLYRACLEGDSGCRFPLDLLLPLMAASKDERILDHLNARCERASLKLPRVRRMKRREPQVINEISRNFYDAMHLVLKFFEDPQPQTAIEIQAALHKHLCEVVALKRAVLDFRQGELL